VLVPLAGRASKVFGSLLEGVADKHHIKSDRVVWVTRLAQLFWGTVEVAVPGSILNLFTNHLLKLLYFFELLLIVASIPLLNPTMQRFGFLMFGLTLAVNVAVLLLGDLMINPRGKKNRRWFAYAVVASLIVPLLLFGLLPLLNLFGIKVFQQYVKEAIEPGNFGWNFKTIFSFLVIILPLTLILLLAIRFSGKLERRQEKNDSSARR
jgi:asparagine N-glycosylation enzyme membrane subunit Stt3